jgi:hypothetical protein
MTQQVIHRTGFRWSEIFIYAAIGLGPLGLAISSSAQAVPTRFAIDALQVTRAMDAASLPTEGVEVKLAAPVTSSVANATVEVESVSTIGPHAVRMRLACSDHAQCLPFFVAATFPDAIDVTKLHGVRPSPFAGSQSSREGNQASSSDGGVKFTSASDPARMRAGAPATLELDEDKIHIRLEVICLQGGASGSRVRVASLDHKQIYTAQVVTPTLLKGEFLK